MIAKLSQSALVRKSHDFLRQLPRATARMKAQQEDYIQRPPIILNSFPKSGTHLMAQILETLPHATDYGTFWSSLPSYTYKERSTKAMKKAMTMVVPGELVFAHLFYDSSFEQDLNTLRSIHFFIYRDPRDVAISEAYYLASMNKWHRLHPHFKRLPSIEAQISFSIQGTQDPNFPYDYPNIAGRFRRYQGWLNSSNVFSLKFEDLVSIKRKEVISQLVHHYANRVNWDVDSNTIIQKALENINPKRSHTFRSGTSGGWHGSFTETHKRQFKEVAGELLIQLGYEKDLNW